LPRPFQLPNQRHGWFVKDVLTYWEHHRIPPQAVESPPPAFSPPKIMSGKVSSLRARHGKTS
jgi:hypothetical protein